MRGKAKARLSSMASISNLSVRMAGSKGGQLDRERWLEARHDIEALCGEVGRGDDIELILKALEAHRQVPGSGVSRLSGEMAKVRKAKPSRRKK